MAAIDYLIEHGFSARVSGKRLVVSPASKLTEDDRQYIKLHRLELLAELAANDGQMRSSNWRVLLEGKVICVMIGMRLGIPSCATKPVATYAAAAP
ncbi:hypothetical protein NLY39_11130 [Pseudomonas sp. KHPS1]|nr:hypothetical protein [Pseudomonas sp. KHPS1]UTH38656.1 hypothetical protein NLY39_11130 [Pseudomonas sp. KHPS1]